MTTRNGRRLWMLSLLVPSLALPAAVLPSEAVGQTIRLPTWMGRDQRRTEQQQRYDQWRQSYDQLRQQRQAVDDRSPTGGLLDIDDNGIEPGQYNIRLPGGGYIRLNVNRQEVPAQPVADYSRTHAAVGQLARQIEGSLRRIKQNVRDDDLQDELEDCIDDIEELVEMAGDREDGDELRDQYKEFDEDWHELEGPLTQAVGHWGYQYIDATRQADDRLHAILRVATDEGYSRGYDRPEVYALANRLNDRMGSAVGYIRENVDGRSSRWIGHRAEAAHHESQEFWGDVRADRSREEIVRSLTRFDRQWDELHEGLRRSDDIGREFYMRYGREIGQLSDRLHEVLRVESPMPGYRERQIQMSYSLTRAADRLRDYTRQSRLQIPGSRQQEMIRQIDDVAVHARDFAEWLQREPRHPEEIRERLDRVTEQWRQADQWISALDDRRYNDIHALAREVDQDMGRLQETVRG